MMKQTSEKPFDVLLFDLGGIFVKLSGAPRMIELTGGRLTVDELWTKWLDSPGVKQFETGCSSSKEFAMAMVDEFGLFVEPSQFLEEFTEWSTSLYPGTRELLKALSSAYTLASLSNTNHIHWDYYREELKLLDFFHYNFPSHETGYIKPDKEAFLNVIHTLSVKPERVLFLDDMKKNVENARETGMAAFQVKGIEQVIACLNDLGVGDDCFPIQFKRSFPVAEISSLIKNPSKYSLA